MLALGRARRRDRVRPWAVDGDESEQRRDAWQRPAARGSQARPMRLSRAVHMASEQVIVRRRAGCLSIPGCSACAHLAGFVCALDLTRRTRPKHTHAPCRNHAKGMVRRSRMTYAMKRAGPSLSWPIGSARHVVATEAGTQRQDGPGIRARMQQVGSCRLWCFHYMRYEMGTDDKCTTLRPCGDPFDHPRPVLLPSDGPDLLRRALLEFVPIAIQR